MNKFYIWADGASSGNPGPAGFGIIICDREHNVIKETSTFIGNATNNVAEYMALVYALQQACVLNAKNVCIFMDSELVVKQIKGEYKVKDQTLKTYYLLARNLIESFEVFTIEHVRREDNKRADELAKKSVK